MKAHISLQSYYEILTCANLLLPLQAQSYKHSMKMQISSNRAVAFVMSLVLLIVVISVLFTNRLAIQLAQEEQRRVEMWAEATRQFILADEDADIDFISRIIEGNTTIPVYMTDSEGKTLFSRNVTKPVADPTQLNGPIEVRISDDNIQYIYYDESTLLRRLRYFPHIEFCIILLFVLVAIVALHAMQRSEQNRVWVGLSKETAHQLGTPISSLIAWQELLAARYPQDELIPELKQDIARLETIAERFSKVGSEPELTPTDINALAKQTLEYLSGRVSNKVSIAYNVQETITDAPVAKVSAPLLSWVLENLIKNAVDAMDGAGQIHVLLGEDEHNYFIDVEDTGRGIERRQLRKIFLPGYTSKTRGWGLGLSLSKRIIEDYHGGKLFVKNTQVGVGTTFRISIEKSENS